MKKTKKGSNFGAVILGILVLCGAFYALGQFSKKSDPTPRIAIAPTKAKPLPTDTAAPTDRPPPTNTLTSTPASTSTPTSTPTPIPTVEEVKTTPIPYVIGGVGDTQLYKGPGDKYEQISTLIMGQTADVVARTSDSSWIKIVIPEGFAWAAAKSTIFSFNLADIPVDDSLPILHEGIAVCDCSTDKFNCPDFSDVGAAQGCFDYCQAIGRGDIHGLDGDNDGLACE